MSSLTLESGTSYNGIPKYICTYISTSYASWPFKGSNTSERKGPYGKRSRTTVKKRARGLTHKLLRAFACLCHSGLKMEK